MAERYSINDAQIAKILATMAEHLGRLTDPAYTKKLREDVLTLPEDQQKAVANAQSVITQGAALKADLKKQADDVNEVLAQRERALKVKEAAVEDVKSLKDEAIAIAVKNKENAIALRKESDRLDGITKQHEATTKKHAEILADIAEKNRLLSVENKKLDDKRREIAEYEAQVTGAAEEMSGMVRAKLVKKAR